MQYSWHTYCTPSKPSAHKINATNTNNTTTDGANKRMKNMELNRVLNKIDEWRDEIIADLQALVKFESYKQQGTETEPYGKQVALALNYMLERGVRFGMHTHNYDNRIGHVEIGGSGRVYGSTESDGELIALLAHLDVVPEGNGWTQPPYEGKTIADNNGALRMYGRGTEDDKGPAVASLYALRALAETGTSLNNKRVRLLLGCDEEAGMGDMEYYCEVGETPTIGFTPDGGYPAIFAEKGIVTSIVEGRGIADPDATHNANDTENTNIPAITITTIDGGDKDNKVPENCNSHILLGSNEVVARMETVLNGVVAELTNGNGAKLSWVVTPTDANTDADTNVNASGAYQYPYQATINASGLSAHAMAPAEGVNAIAIMMNTLTRVFAAVGESNTLLDYFQTYYVGDEHRIEGCDTRGKCVGANHRDEPSGELTWNTAIIHYKGEIPSNKAETNFTFAITHNIRYCVTLSWDTLGNEITNRLVQYDAREFAVTVRDTNHLPPLYLEKDTRLINAVSEAYKSITGDANALPQSSGGGTYARWFDNFVAIGFAIRNKELVIHQADEYIYIDDLIDSTKIYATAIYNLINSEE